MKKPEINDKIVLEMDGKSVWSHIEGEYGPHVVSGFGDTIPASLRDLANAIEKEFGNEVQV